jgi:hypothetical protein
LSTIWHRYAETERLAVALKIAEIIVDMAETRFSAIGGPASPAGSILGPTLEGSKLFKGRVSRPFVLILLIINLLDRVNFIPIDATPSVHTKPQRDTFSLATTKKHTTIPASDMNPDLFEVTSLEDFVQQLRDKKRQLETSFVAEDEPFVLVHGDFRGRNVIMHGTQVQAVLDWEFAFALPLSELLGEMGVDVMEVYDYESEEENALWSREIVCRVEETETKKMGFEGVGTVIGKWRSCSR